MQGKQTHSHPACSPLPKETLDFFLGKRKTSSLKLYLETHCSLHINSVHNRDIETIKYHPAGGHPVSGKNKGLPSRDHSLSQAPHSVSYSVSFLSERKSWGMMLADWQAFTMARSLQVRCGRDHLQRHSCRRKRPSDKPGLLNPGRALRMQPGRNARRGSRPSQARSGSWALGYQWLGTQARGYMLANNQKSEWLCKMESKPSLGFYEDKMKWHR